MLQTETAVDIVSYGSGPCIIIGRMLLGIDPPQEGQALFEGKPMPGAVKKTQFNNNGTVNLLQGDIQFRAGGALAGAALGAVSSDSDRDGCSYYRGGRCYRNQGHWEREHGINSRDRYDRYDRYDRRDERRADSTSTDHSNAKTRGRIHMESLGVSNVLRHVPLCSLARRLKGRT